MSNWKKEQLNSIFIELFALLITNFLTSLCILDIRSLSDVGLVKMFSHSIGYFFLVDCVLYFTETFLFHLLLFINCFSQCLLVAVIFKNLSPVPMCSSVLPTLSSKTFSVTESKKQVGEIGWGAEKTVELNKKL